jgi:CubicO group peptidase (beta-lactamase class C family)
MRAGVVAAIIACMALGPSLAQAAAREPPTPAPPLETGARGGHLAPETPIPPADLQTVVDVLVRDAMVRDHVAGVSVAIVQDGQVVLEKGYGFAGPGRPVDPDRTLFRIGSISKTFTWIAAMKEVEAGHMRLDGPIDDYLPIDLAIPVVPGWRPVELRDLMSHTPGFEDRPLDHLILKTPAQILPLAAQLRLSRPKRVFPPGTTPAYSNYGAALAGEAIAHLEGVSFQDLADREMIAPLRLAHTTFREPYPPSADLPAPMSRSLAAAVTTGYQWTGAEFKAEPFEWLSQAAPAGAASSTAGDMARYMLMMLGDGELNGVRIYGTATALAFRTPIELPIPGGGQVDHGFFQIPLPGGFMGYGHDGDTLWCHSNLVTVPALKLGIFVTTNTDTGPQLVEELPQLIVGNFYAASPEAPRSGSPEPGAERAVYAGTYLPNRRPFTGLEKSLFLILGGLWGHETLIHVTPSGYLVTPSEGGVRTWTPTGRPGHFQAAEGPLTSDFRMHDGKAVEWYPPGGDASFDRVGPLYQRNVLLLVMLLALAAVAATLIGPVIRFGRPLPATSIQRRLNSVQLLAAGAWLIALCAGAVFAGRTDDLVQLLDSWPGAPLMTASSAALAASLLSAGILIASPFAWMGDGGWGFWRKLRYTVTSVLFCALGLQLAFWGFLEPWSP